MAIDQGQPMFDVRTVREVRAISGTLYTFRFAMSATRDQSRSDGGAEI